MPDNTNPFTYVVLYADGPQGTETLVVRRHLIQKWLGGRPSNPIIPQWAGQWGVICAQPERPQPTDKAAYAAFFAQTAINLIDPPIAAKYQVVSTVAKTLQDADYNPIPLLYVACEYDGLQLLQRDIQNNIEALKPQNGVLETSAVKRISEAETLIGPVAPPPEGWKKYVIAHYYGGNPPRLNPPIDAQTKVMTERSARPPVGYRVAIENIPQTEVIPPPLLGARLVALRVTGAEQTSNGLWYQTYEPGQWMFVQAVTEPFTPEAQAQVFWSGGIDNPFGSPGLRVVPLDTLTPPGAPIRVEARLGARSQSVEVAVVPDLLALDVTGAYAEIDGKWGLDQSDKGTPAVVRAVTEPANEIAHLYLDWSGGEIDPSHPFDRRLVSFEQVARAGHGLPVEVAINLA